MTRLGYIFAKVFSTLGVASLEKYRTAAAFEAHLLRDSETVIGQLAWTDLEDISDISAEYWKLRKLSKRENELGKEIHNLTQTLESSQDSRAQALEEVAEATKGQVTERDQAAEKIDRLLQEREEIQKTGRSIKRVHSGLKTKLEVLLEELDGEKNPETERTRDELTLKRTQFEEIKGRRDEIDARIAELQKRLVELTAIIEEENAEIRDQANQQFSTIGKTNKELTSLKSKMGLVESRKEELCSEVGRFVINNAKNPEIRKATSAHKSVLALIEEIKASSYRHRKIIGS